MTATLDNGNASNDWRTKGICEEGSEVHFVDIATLVEDGLAEDEAMKVAAVAEAEAKRICGNCPVQSECGDFAMANGEEWGVWGALSAADRDTYRPLWLRLQGTETVGVIEQERDPWALHADAGVSAKLETRNRRAREIRDRLLNMDEFSVTSRRVGSPSREDFLYAMDLILSNPSATGKDLGNRVGRAADWVNEMVRAARVELDID